MHDRKGRPAGTDVSSGPVQCAGWSGTGNLQRDVPGGSRPGAPASREKGVNDDIGGAPARTGRSSRPVAPRRSGGVRAVLNAVPVRTTVATVLLAATLAGCAPWQKAMEAWRARSGGSRPYATLEGTKWIWKSGVIGDDVIAVTFPNRYSIEFLPEHRLTLRADCNLGRGAWSAKLDQIDLGPMGFTRAQCAPDSYSGSFISALGSARVWYIRDGSLFLELSGGRGTLRFELVDATVS